jgi:beta-galactosidase GanA
MNQKNRIFYFLLLIFFYQSAVGQNLKMPKEIILGTVYSYFNEEYPTDNDFFKRVDRDIPDIKKANLNALLVWPVTQWDPHTKQLSWTRGDYLMNKIEHEGLNASILLFKQQQSRHWFPIWKFDVLDSIRESQKAQLNGQNNVDFQVPEVKNILVDYLEKVLERYRNKPNLILYNVWNEPHYYSESDRNIARFQRWLKNKYKSLDELNRVWADDYTSWDQPSPLLDQDYYSSMADIDWMIYKDDLTAEIINELKDIVREKDPSRPVNANPVGGLFMNGEKPGQYVIDEWIAAKANDINGISYYPDLWEKGANMNQHAPFYRHNFVFNTLRSASAGKPYMMTEIQTHSQNGLAIVSYFDYNKMHLITWSAIANDCKGFFFWQWNPILRGRQSFGRGLTLANGDLAPRGEAVKDVGAVLKKYGQELYRAHPVDAKAAILLDKLSLLKSFDNIFSAKTLQIVHDSYEGTFKALFEKDIIPDVVRADLDLTLEKIKPYRIIYLPFQIVMRKNVADILKKYVENGGTVVADSRTAIIDESDFAYTTNPGAGLTELFGVVRIDHIGIDGSYKVTVTDNSVFEGVKKGDSFRGIFFKEQWKLLKGAETIAEYEDGTPAMVVNKYGKGNAILSGVPLGASYLKNSGNPVNKIIAGAALKSGAAPDVSIGPDENDEVNLYLHRSGNTSYIYLINSSENNFSGKLTLKKQGALLEVKNLINEQVSPFIYENGIVSFNVSVPPSRTCIFRIE